MLIGLFGLFFVCMLIYIFVLIVMMLIVNYKMLNVFDFVVVVVDVLGL